MDSSAASFGDGAFLCERPNSGHFIAFFGNGCFQHLIGNGFRYGKCRGFCLKTDSNVSGAFDGVQCVGDKEILYVSKAD